MCTVIPLLRSKPPHQDARRNAENIHNIETARSDRRVLWDDIVFIGKYLFTTKRGVIPQQTPILTPLYIHYGTRKSSPAQG